MAPKLRLRDLREDKFWSQKEVADLLRIKRRTYVEYELENNMIPIELLSKLAVIYHVSVDYICRLTNIPTAYGTYKLYKQDIFLRNIKLLREKSNLSQKDFGAIFSYSQNTISEYEKGLRSIPVDFLINLSKHYKIPTDYILGTIYSRTPVANK